MTKQFDQRLALFADPRYRDQLRGINRGIEKESLRIRPDRKLASTPHPQSLGAPLTHPRITTDFSEALLELITPVQHSVDAVLAQLDDVHRIVYDGIASDELLWAASMPCVLGDDPDIPVAQYGSSNSAQMKTIYRLGLGHRYGRAMQTIAGIHYNFSLGDHVWPLLAEQDGNTATMQDYITRGYFDLIRNFQRFSWLIVYLFGASPAVCGSFLRNRPGHGLAQFDAHTLHQPGATSLRMGRLGYSSDAQAGLNICYNSLQDYIKTLHRGITTDHPEYTRIGTHINGRREQLSAGLLQIENEFYSAIRPKRVTRSGEIPLGALQREGVEYIEVRCLDLNPELPLGIDKDTIMFLDAFLLYCLFEISPLCDDDARARNSANMLLVVESGRNGNLTLQTNKGEMSFADAASALFDGIAATGELLFGDEFQPVLRSLQNRVQDPAATPSGKIIDAMRRDNSFWAELMTAQSRRHADYFRARRPDETLREQAQRERDASLEKRAAIEAADNIDFETYLARFYRQYDDLRINA